jgi:hypothetical protein
MIHRPTRFALAFAAALQLTLAASPGQALPMAGNTPPVLSFGVGNSPVGSLDRIGDMPLGYRYQYFTGGLGADDWRFWSAPDGAFLDNWLNETRDAGLVPVVTYYEVVHAEPNPGDDPPLENLQVPQTMRAYFENWIFLLQRIAAFGQPVVVHLEPDLFGNTQWNDPDPARTPVAVASSGLAQAAGYEDNMRGYARLMVALRDQYAPNVILGWHVSNWATRTDLILNQGDPDELALETAAYYRALGAEFDVMFSEFSDRDSGYYQKNGSPERWWKPQDFDTFRRFIGRLSSELHQEVILWQIPNGNTLYRSCNNTRNHYQDNRPEYFLQSVVEQGDTTRLEQYRQAGVVAFLFGAGQDDQTLHFDARKDGITNPAPIDNRKRNHTNHLNDREALNADDDGGFLRLGISTYYANGPLPLDRPPAACGDGVDNDGDGLVDYPADPGCTSIHDATEHVPPPACGDGKDNDGDGLMDFPADPGCSSAADDNEFNPPPPTQLPALITMGTDWGSGYCADGKVVNNGTEAVVWSTTFTVPGTVSSLWNAEYTQTGDQVKANGVEWNRVLAAGASASFGFCAERRSDEADQPPAGANISTSLGMDSDWGSGYCAHVDVTNNSPSPQTWEISLPVEGHVDDLWNARFSQSGSQLKAWGFDWNGVLAAGQTLQFGFCASR